MNKHRICAISDLHGYLGVEVPECETLLICGDTVTGHISRPPKVFNASSLELANEEEKEFFEMMNVARRRQWDRDCSNWFTEKFNPWVRSLPTKDVIMIAGNHDFVFQENDRSHIEAMLADAGNLRYIEDEEVETIGGLRVYGTPLCHKFFNWAFMPADDTALAEKLAAIPEGLDILMTHDAAYGRNDVLLQKAFDQQGHIGSKPLDDRLRSLQRKPRYHFTGHLHSTDHSLVDYDGTLTACVSILDEHYRPTYAPLVIDIEK